MSSRIPKIATFSTYFASKIIRSANKRQGLAAELIYRSLFEKDLRRLGIEDRYYPVEGAANHGLLYFMLRLLQEHREIEILDVGAGASSQLLSDAAQKISGLRVTTLEHDEAYSDWIAPTIRHEFIRTPLVQHSVEGRTVKFFDLTPIKDRRFDVIFVDGPRGERRWSRFGAVHLFERHLKDEFLFVMDDAHRMGELDTIMRLLPKIRNNNRIAGYRMFSSNKSQFLAYTKRFRSAQIY